MVADVGGRERHLGGRAGARQGAGGFAHAEFGGQVAHEVDTLGGLELRGQGLRCGADALGADDEVGVCHAKVVLCARGVPRQEREAGAGRLHGLCNGANQPAFGQRRGEVDFIGQVHQARGPPGRGSRFARKAHREHGAQHAGLAAHAWPECGQGGALGGAAQQLGVQELQAVGVRGVHMQVDAGRRARHVPRAEQFGMVKRLAAALLAQAGIGTETRTFGGSDRGGVAVLVEPIGQPTVAGRAIGQRDAGIVFKQAARGRVDVLEGEAVLVLGDVVRLLRVQTTVVEEDQGLAVDEHLAGVAQADGALREVPVGDVVARVAQHGDALEHAGDQVHPALIDKDAFVHRNHAVVVQLALPPLQVAVGVGALPDGTKPEVVGAGAADVEFGGAAVVGDGVEQVGREDDVGALLQQLLHFAQGLVEADVGVDVDDLLVPLPQQVLHGPGLDSGVEFKDGVLEQEVLPVRQGQLVERDGLEFFGQCACGGRVAVHNDAVAFGLGVVRGNALQQGARKVQVVVADDGDDGKRIHVARGW